MATFTYVDLKISEAALYADLYGISVDLHDAREMAETLKKELTVERPNCQLVELYSIAITVKYSRCFVTGIRARLKEEDLSILSPEHRKAHERIRAIRDKHIVHSINSFEENQPRANYCLERLTDEGITGISCEHGRIVGLGLGDLENVIELTTILSGRIESLMEQEKTKLLATVRQMPIDEILSGGQKARVIDGNARVDKPRKK
jgi:hypothetical protein